MYHHNNYSKSHAQLYQEHNKNVTLAAEHTNKIGYNLAMKHNMGFTPTYDNMLYSSWNIQVRQPQGSTNRADIKQSHYVPLPARFKWDLTEHNDSTQKVPDSSLLFTRSQVPRGFM